MNCREFSDFLMNYLDGELPPAQHDSFEGHLRLCPDCVTYLRTYEETVALGKTVCRDPEGPVPDEVPESLVAAILSARTIGEEER